MPTITTQDGVSIHYEVSGEGDPVFLVHGITESGRFWDPIVERLSGRYRVIAPDLRGHGRSGTAGAYDLGSMAGDLAAVAAAEGIEKARFVGHSLGAAVVTALAGAMPMRSAVNVDQPLALGELMGQLLEVESMLRDPESFPVVISGLFDQLAGTALDPDERARMEGHRRPDQDVVLGVWALMFDSSKEEVDAAVDQILAAVKCPYLALYGTDLGPEYTAWLAGAVPSATVETWDGLGHYPHLVEPDRFVARLEEFWQTD